jgi:erythromycin esterase
MFMDMQKNILKTLTIIFSIIGILSCTRSQQSTNYVASNKELKWLENNCIRLKTVEAGNGFEDLEPLKKIIGTSRIVGLGEFSHGSSEVFKMKHRLIEFLVTEMGFNIFAIEENMPDGYLIDNYVLKNEGNPKELLHNGMWIWNTQEVLDLIQWMRIYNSNDKNKIQYSGFDMQLITPAYLNLRKFAEQHDKFLKSELDSIGSILEKGQSEGQNNPAIFELAKKINIRGKGIVSYFIENKNSIVKTIHESEYQWLAQNATLIVQGTSAKKGRTMITRDSCMAENVTWLLNSRPDAKIILWAHNQHIRKDPRFFGGFLSKRYGNDYYNIGFLSNSGTFSASTSSGVQSNVMEESKPGSFEYSFHKTKIPIFLLDFTHVNKNISESKWLTKELNTRFIGSYILKDSMILSQKISNCYNSVIYIDSTHASNFFGSN